MNLQYDLERERIHWLQEQPAPASAVEVMAMEWLRQDGIEGRVLRVGERAPEFRLPDQNGSLVGLERLRAQGPAILLFYRGHWCPFCSLSLRAYQAAVSRFAALRVSVVAISPQGLVATRETARLIGEGLPLLSDVGSHVARAYGLAYDLPPPLRTLFENEYATPLPQINSDSGWTLPVTAVYVVGQNGLVLRAQVDIDYRRRQDPQDLLAWLAVLDETASPVRGLI